MKYLYRLRHSRLRVEAVVLASDHQDAMKTACGDDPCWRDGDVMIAPFVAFDTSGASRICGFGGLGALQPLTVP